MHKKKCGIQQVCSVKKITSQLENELQIAILRKAAVFEQEATSKNKRKRRKIKDGQAY